MIIWRAAAVVFQILRHRQNKNKKTTCAHLPLSQRGAKVSTCVGNRKKSMTRNSKYWQWCLKCTASFSGSSQLRGKGFAGERVFYWRAAGGRINVVYRYPKYLLPLQATHLQQTPPWLSSTSTIPFLSVSPGFRPSTFHDCFLPLFAWQDNG